MGLLIRKFSFISIIKISILIFLPLSLLSVDFSSTQIHSSCFNARELSQADRYCDFVSWTAAYLYTPGNYSLYNPGRPLSDNEQSKYAIYIYNSYVNGNSLGIDCKDSLKRLACVNSFPYCPLASNSIAGIAPFPTCKQQCEQANSKCSSFNVILNCDSYPNKYCSIFVPPGYFVLPVEQGPYNNIQYLYILVLTFWVFASFLWNYLTFYVFKYRCVLLCRAVGGVPIVKAVVAVFAVAFWSTCSSWNMCSFWLGVSLTNTHLVYETGEILVFILVSKGWSITRETFTPNEWRTIIMSLSGFYMANSILLVLESSVLTATGFWVASAILYGVVYCYILINVTSNLRFLHKETAFLAPPPVMPQEIVAPLMEKYRMYLIFLVLVFVSIGMEVFCHALLASSSSTFSILLVYEISNAIILGYLGYIFRPREYSPFFFMVSARRDSIRNGPIVILEACYDEGDEVIVGRGDSGGDDGDGLVTGPGLGSGHCGVVELAPLIRPPPHGREGEEGPGAGDELLVGDNGDDGDGDEERLLRGRLILIQYPNSNSNADRNFNNSNRFALGLSSVRANNTNYNHNHDTISHSNITSI